MPSTAIYCSCTQCKSTISTANLNKHYNSKQCKSGSKQSSRRVSICPHCSIDTIGMTPSNIANHVRWCHKNPNINAYKEKASDTSQLITPHAMCKKRESIKIAHKQGKYSDAPSKLIATKTINDSFMHTEESIAKIRESALNSPHQRKCKKTHEFVDKQGRKFNFDSTWEDALAHRLDQLNIKWTRPNPIKWVDSSGKTRNYFPDFYLVDYNVFIDPKNPYCVKEQKEKLEIVSKIIHLIILPTIESCKTFKIDQWL